MLRTSWTEGTRNPFKAIRNFISCAQYGYNCWIEIRSNEDCDYPIKIKNPALNNPENWRFSYGIPTTGKEPEDQYFNETQRDLTLNYKSMIRDKEGKTTVQGMGESIQVRIPYGLHSWTDHWEPKTGIPYWIPDPNISKVFIVCHDAAAEKSIPWWIKIFLVPFRFIPQYHKLVMNEYTNYSLRIGDVFNGYRIEIQIPKKFSFK